MLILITLYMSILFTLTLVEDRESALRDCLAGTPLTKWQCLIDKAILLLIAFLVQALLVIVVIGLWQILLLQYFYVIAVSFPLFIVAG